MKKLLFILLLFSFFHSNAQRIDTALILFHGETLTKPPYRDTIPVKMLSSDGSNRIFVEQGYAIRYHSWAYHSDYSKVNESMIITYEGYLDQHKKPLNKNISVWISKPK